ncbi:MULTISPECIES: hypothetical protein [Legionella]|uniref:DUF883 domain-containing protein n=1 Tax=Legionella drozanskii LLAP-1 TaxID=1212489 RepID=A0A0W0SW18_9GAMM|nr:MULTISPECIES: hypothetical protein [Legionella]KTC87492.1 hypothetical protein Ldro_1111 [Legionella drozanskii LLAP-1]PJE10474.1 MAG: hypothetical protein CK430_10360 [Legionella sp.]
MNIGKEHTDDFLGKTKKLGSHLYAEGKDALDEFGDQVIDKTHKMAHKIHDEPIPSLLIAIGVGVILSGLLLSKLSKR